MFPQLASSVRDLANDNIITAVMLTGVMLLQVSLVESCEWWSAIERRASLATA
jgi:hypothetical protein